MNDQSLAEAKAQALQQVEADTLLDGHDRQLLREIVADYAVDRVPELSFMSRSAVRQIRGRYVVESSDSERHYVLNRNGAGASLAGAVMDDEGRFLSHSNFAFHHPYRLVKALPQLLAWQSRTRDDSWNVDVDVVATERWPPSFGHLVDEMYTTAAFLAGDGAPQGAVPLVDFDQAAPGSPASNPGLVAHALFQGNMLNSSAHAAPMMRVGRISLVGTRIAYPTFHEFPRTIRDRVVDFYGAGSLMGADPPSKVMLVRGVSPDPGRVIPRVAEMVEAARELGFTVIHHEDLPLYDLVRVLRNVDVMAGPWGGSFTNAAYLPQGARVVLAKPSAYSSEELQPIFGNLIREHQLDVTSVPADGSDKSIDAWRRILTALL